MFSRLLSGPERAAGADERYGGFARLHPALPEQLAVLVHRALRSAPHAPTQHVDPDRGHQLWRYGWEPGTDCTDHPLCDLGHALLRDPFGALAAMYLHHHRHKVDKRRFALVVWAFALLWVAGPIVWFALR